METEEHLCSIYQGTVQQFSQLVPYIVDGLDHNKKCVYVPDDNTSDQVISELNKSGLNINKYLATGQFQFLSVSETYLKNGVFEPKKMLDLIVDTENKAFLDGYGGILGVAEMTWTLRDGIDEQKLLDYEAQLNNSLGTKKSTLLCQYNEVKFSHQTLNNVIRMHRQLFIYGKLYDNKYLYRNPTYFREGIGSVPSKDYQTLVKIIVDG
jgi:archaellum biogenesis ATPase FlaH